MDKKARQQRLAGFDEDSDAPVHRGTPGEPGPPARQPAATVSLHGQSVYVLDAHSLIYQVFHALPEMSGPSGQPVGAVLGFLRDIVDILERRKPDYLLCAFDPPGKTFRHDVYDQYKVDRPTMPLDLQLQIPNIQRFLHALAIPVLSVAGYEADDVLATVGAEARRLGGECYLVTNDKDCRQLINEQVKLYNIRKNEVVDAEAVEKQWGIRPDQVVDFQTLWGDSTDNVPGVAGIGQKTAAQLLAQYGTLEEIFAHVEEIPGQKRRESITQGRELALISRRLVRLVDNVPLDIDWPAAHVGGMDVEAVLELCAEFGFHTLPKRLTGLMVRSAPGTWDAAYELVATRVGFGRPGIHARQPASHRGGHRDDLDARPLGRACRLLVRLARGTRSMFRCELPRGTRNWIRPRRWRRCVRFWRTRTSRRSGRISSTT